MNELRISNANGGEILVHLKRRVDGLGKWKMIVVMS